MFEGVGQVYNQLKTLPADEDTKREELELRAASWSAAVALQIDKVITGDTHEIKKNCELLRMQGLVLPIVHMLTITLRHSGQVLDADDEESWATCTHPEILDEKWNVENPKYGACLVFPEQLPQDAHELYKNYDANKVVETWVKGVFPDKFFRILRDVTNDALPKERTCGRMVKLATAWAAKYTTTSIIAPEGLQATADAVLSVWRGLAALASPKHGILSSSLQDIKLILPRSVHSHSPLLKQLPTVGRLILTKLQSGPWKEWKEECEAVAGPAERLGPILHALEERCLSASVSFNYDIDPPFDETSFINLLNDATTHLPEFAELRQKPWHASKDLEIHIFSLCSQAFQALKDATSPNLDLLNAMVNCFTVIKSSGAEVKALLQEMNEHLIKWKTSACQDDLKAKASIFMKKPAPGPLQDVVWALRELMNSDGKKDTDLISSLVKAFIEWIIEDKAALSDISCLNLLQLTAQSSPMSAGDHDVWVHFFESIAVLQAAYEAGSISFINAKEAALVVGPSGDRVDDLKMHIEQWVIASRDFKAALTGPATCLDATWNQHFNHLKNTSATEFFKEHSDVHEASVFMIKELESKLMTFVSQVKAVARGGAHGSHWAGDGSEDILARYTATLAKIDKGQIFDLSQTMEEALQEVIAFHSLVSSLDPSIDLAGLYAEAQKSAEENVRSTETTRYEHLCCSALIKKKSHKYTDEKKAEVLRSLTAACSSSLKADWKNCLHPLVVAAIEQFI